VLPGVIRVADAGDGNKRRAKDAAETMSQILIVDLPVSRLGVKGSFVSPNLEARISLKLSNSFFQSISREFADF
jgi:hypothetical protein